MDDTPPIRALLTFARVVEAGSFSAAARALGRSRQSVHREVTRLETDFGVRLVERTTKRLRVTDAGLRLHAHAATLVQEAQRALHTLRASRAGPSGTLRVSAPHLLGERFVVTVIARFLERWPDVRVEAEFTLEPADPLNRDVDVALRVGALPMLDARARRLGMATEVCCAAPAYLGGAAALEVPSDLARHATLHYGRSAPRAMVEWHLGTSMDTRVLHLPRLVSTSAQVVRQLTLAGLGVSRLPLLLCRRDLEDGGLVEVLGAWRHAGAPVNALYASHTTEVPAVREFLDELSRAAAAAPW